MKVVHHTLDDCDEASGVAIVIDVIRAFTTATIAFERGAEKIIFVSSSSEAFDLKEADPTRLIMGEEHGLPPEGYDYGNSPWELANENLSGRTLIQRTSHGTQGLVRCTHCDEIYAASFANVSATARAVMDAGHELVSIINTGARPDHEAEEDASCADYLHALLYGESPPIEHFLERVENSTAGSIFKDESRPRFVPQDLELCKQADRCNFAIKVEREGDLLVARSSL